MEAKACAKSVRISPFKARLVIDLIRGKNAKEAQIILSNYNNKAARLTKKVLDSAIANAVNNNKLDQTKLFVKEVRVDMGKTLKRNVPDSRGRIAQNYHRHSHITVVVGERA